VRCPGFAVPYPAIASLIGVICRVPSTRESVRALISDVSHFHCHRGCPNWCSTVAFHIIYGSGALHRWTKFAESAPVLRSPQWKSCRQQRTTTGELSGRWALCGKRSHLIHRNVVVDGCGIQVIALGSIGEQGTGRFLRHGAWPKFEPKYSYCRKLRP